PRGASASPGLRPPPAHRDPRRARALGGAPLPGRRAPAALTPAAGNLRGAAAYLRARLGGASGSPSQSAPASRAARFTPEETVLYRARQAHWKTLLSRGKPPPIHLPGPWWWESRGVRRSNSYRGP